MAGPASAKAAPARVAALAAVSERRRRQGRIREILRASKEMSALDERDRALATRLAMGAVAAEGELDRIIDSHVRRGSRLEPCVRDALRISAFELVYLSTPAAVAASQGVELVRGVAPKAAGLANAVLRRVADRDTAAYAKLLENVGGEKVTTEELMRLGGLPLWLAEAGLESLGAQRAVAWARHALEPVVASVAVNRALNGADEAEALLKGAECEPVEGPLPGSFVLGRPSRLVSSGLVEGADVVPCDLAAQETALLARPAAGARVLEVGQGRGTKSILLESVAIAAGEPCKILAVELDAKKSDLAARRMEAAGLSEHVGCICDDATALNSVEGTFDLVFVDAPCSGTGTLARHPEIAWSLAEKSVAGLASTQQQMLAAAAAHVARGRRLVYSTCSILEEENERVVEAFLASPAGLGFSLVSMHRTDIPGADCHFAATLRRG